MSKQNRKSNKSSNVANVANVANVEAREQNVTLFRERVIALTALIATLSARDVSTLSSDEQKEHFAQLKNLQERNTRAEAFANAIANDDAYALAFEQRTTFARVNALAIYAQDKVMQVLRSIARDCAIMSSNFSTREVLRKLAREASTSKELAAHLVSTSHKNVNTASTQASSSINALLALALVECDSVTKRYSIKSDMLEVCEALAA